MRRLFSNRKFQVVFNGALAAVVLAAVLVGGRRFARGGWPLHHADPLLVAGAALLFLVAYAFKAWGWQRLFAAEERPGAGALAFAGGAACVGGVALPGRLDDALRIAVVKRFPGVRTGLASVALSLLVLGLLDNVALAPLASVAAVNASSWTVQLGFAVVAAAGVLAAGIVASLPTIASRPFVMRFRIGRWLASRAHCNRRAAAALLFISISWALRGTAVFLLLEALSMNGSSFPLALAFLCASAASAALPIAPAGAATQAGAGAAILMASGVHSTEAIAFSVSAQVLVVGTGAVVVLSVAAWQMALRLRSRGFWAVPAVSLS
ncbi:MAG TPA: lysylphosphatidylglycerol synthase domain-containing protein [Gaiellaceae bacterium]|nr:lysylphosphatidylglycerol synthase domain-containing protein [Gaiellaceae bacterium]